MPDPYRRLWWAAAVDGLGDGASAAALPLLAVTVTRDPRAISVVTAAAYLPWLLLSLPVGAAVDRYDRVPLMWRAQAAQAVAAATLALLAATGHAGVPALAALAFALGAGEVVFGTAAQAVLPDLVPAAALPRANGHQYAATTVGRTFLGPPLGSLLFATAAALPFGVDAATFAVSAAVLATLPRRPRKRLPARRAVADGLRWLARHRLLRTLALLLGANTFCLQLATGTLVLLATGPLHLTPRGYGVLLAGAAAGGVLGGLAGARILARTGTLPTLLGSLGANAVLLAAIGLSPNAVVLGTLLAANGFATTLWNVATVSLRQQLVPPDLLGRVTSAYRLLGWGLIPLGALAGGLLTHAYGLRAAAPVAGSLRALALAAALPILLATLREGELPSEGNRSTDGSGAPTIPG